MSGNGKWMHNRFRALSIRGQDILGLLSELRKSRPISEYNNCISALRIAGGKQAVELFFLGPNAANKLVWNTKPLEALTLEKELIWSKYWLQKQGQKLSTFRKISLEIQNLVLEDKTPIAINKLDQFIKTSGWSLWAVELRCALEQNLRGSNAQRDWIAPLQASAVNSIPGLLFEIFSDRCDDTFSFDTFYSKCLNSFPRFHPIAPWLVDYLQYRTLGHVDDARIVLPNILAREITSSLIDYYEALIETITYIVIEESLIEFRQHASDVVRSLISNHFHDSRLTKLAIALQPITDDEVRNVNNMEPDHILVRALYYKQLPVPNHSETGFSYEIVKLLERCRNEGITAPDAIESLIKLGVNFKGLDFGGAIATSVIQLASSDISSKLPINSVLFSDRSSIEDISAYPIEIGLKILEKDIISQQLETQIASDTLSIINSKSIKLQEPPNVLHLWAAHQLLERKSYEDLEIVLNYLKNKGGYWDRQVAKFEFVSLSRQGNLIKAIELVNEWLIRDPRYVVEFPMEELFNTRKWVAFREIDPVSVGLATHYAHQSSGTSSIGYLCKMACRSFLISDNRKNINDLYDKMTFKQRQAFVTFLCDVWVEENLSLCHQFESTESVRSERMETLQLLISWDSERTVQYVQEIKDLTFDQTLQRGLLQIDQTRIFVNESAINRWAEAELLQDYERWKRLSESSSGGRVVDDMLRQYALDPANNSFLKEFTNGKPTSADVLLIDIIDRLYKRFLLDPTDGLDCYLSLRIRHGSLRGTVFGSLEEHRLLYSTSGFSEEEFVKHWNGSLKYSQEEMTEVFSDLEIFSRDLKVLVDDLVNERIQILSSEKPNGAFKHYFSPEYAKLLAAGFSELPISFSSFLATCYFAFWKLVELGLKDINTYISIDFKKKLKELFDRLIQDLRSHQTRSLPLITAIQTVSTTTQSQCDVIADWFRIPGHVEDEDYQLPDAIEIASAATRNVYRAFSADLQVTCSPSINLPLTTSALAVLTDCLFVIFENAWKHAGIGSAIRPINLETIYDTNTKLLTFVVLSDLSVERRERLLGGQLSELRSKYIGELPLDLVSREGGSGFAKLARLVRHVSPIQCSTPFDFGVENKRWFVRVTVPLYEREGRFEAYE